MLTLLCCCFKLMELVFYFFFELTEIIVDALTFFKETFGFQEKMTFLPFLNINIFFQIIPFLFDCFLLFLKHLCQRLYLFKNPFNLFVKKWCSFSLFFQNLRSKKHKIFVIASFHFPIIPIDDISLLFHVNCFSPCFHKLLFIRLDTFLKLNIYISVLLLEIIQNQGDFKLAIRSIIVVRQS